MKIYNKLVRDKIIDIIEADGRIAKYRILDDNEYRQELNKKLQEELNPSDDKKNEAYSNCLFHYTRKRNAYRPSTND